MRLDGRFARQKPSQNVRPITASRNMQYKQPEGPLQLHNPTNGRAGRDDFAHT
jgi:hypothetical protein